MRMRCVCIVTMVILLLSACGGTGQKVTGDDLRTGPFSPDSKSEVWGELPVEPACVDNDGDGYGEGCAKGADCNDTIKACHVDCSTDEDLNGVPDCEEKTCTDAEVPYNGVDDDCDPATPDSDLDGDQHDGFAAGGDDCDDEDPEVHPGATEVCGDWLDNGIGLQWHGSLDPGQGSVVSDIWSFGPLPTPTPHPSPTATEAPEPTVTALPSATPLPAASPSPFPLPTATVVVPTPLPTPPAEIPEAGSLVLLGSGLASLVGYLGLRRAARSNRPRS